MREMSGERIGTQEFHAGLFRIPGGIVSPEAAERES